MYNSSGHLVGTYNDLRGNTQQGDTVTVSFTVPAGDYDQLSLVSYYAPESFYEANDASLQAVDQSVTQVFEPGYLHQCPLGHPAQLLLPGRLRLRYRDRHARPATRTTSTAPRTA